MDRLTREINGRAVLARQFPTLGDTVDVLCDRLAIYEEAAESRPAVDWHEDIGDVLWWKFPVDEPPYCGSPLDEDWPGYHTHFTMLVVPELPKGESK